jgi:outer membrane autotransporter protein
VGIGYDFGAIRAELTYGYTYASLNDVDGNVRINGERIGNFDLGSSGTVNKNDVMASVYWDMLSNSRWTPYIGGGIGYTNLSTDGIKVGGERIGDANRGLFGWQAKAGVSYGLTSNWDVYAEGTYSGASGFESDNVDYGSFNNWGGKIGFRYRFAQPQEVVVVEPMPQPEPEPAPMPMPEPEPEPTPAPIRGLW